MNEPNTIELMKKIRRIEIRTRHLVQDLFAGNYLSVFKGRGIEFDQVRKYEIGDDVRSVDWNVTARMGDLYVKRFVEERELTMLLVVDMSASNDFGTQGQFKRDAAIEMAAMLAFSAVRNNDKVGLLLFTDRIEKFIPPRKGRKHILRLLRELLSFKPVGRGTDINLALEHVNRVLKRRGIIVLVSDFQNDADSYRKNLNMAGKRHDLIAIDLRDPMESEIANVGLLALQDAETGELVEVDTSDKAWRAAFAKRMAEYDAAKKRVWNGAKVDRIILQTPDDHVGALTRFFQGRMKRMAH
ncbi:MAG: DUF58 domain-containing protein [Chloroflexota bacterium]|nr:MAG: DUF58 domain-containing protein [Chloroflexota bacterium]